MQCAYLPIFFLYSNHPTLLSSVQVCIPLDKFPNILHPTEHDSDIFSNIIHPMHARCAYLPKYFLTSSTLLCMTPIYFLISSTLYMRDVLTSQNISYHRPTPMSITRIYLLISSTRHARCAYLPKYVLSSSHPTEHN